MEEITKWFPLFPDSPFLFFNSSLVFHNLLNLHQLCYLSKAYPLVTVWSLTIIPREKIICSPSCTLCPFLVRVECFFFSTGRLLQALCQSVLYLLDLITFFTCQSMSLEFNYILANLSQGPSHWWSSSLIEMLVSRCSVKNESPVKTMSEVFGFCFFL